MMRSLYSGVAGLKNHQLRMDTIGNNLANVNTVGYKASRVVFQDMFSQMQKPASGGTATLGGVNPQQVGLGVSTAAVDIMFNSSPGQNTGSWSDLAIQGEGFFILKKDNENVYTRAGNFYLDANSDLVAGPGFYVQGLQANAAGTIPAATPTTKLNIPMADYYDVSIAQNGEIWGLKRTDGTRALIGQVQLATFENQSGLEKLGNNVYRSTVNSGPEIKNVPGANGVGKTQAYMLEMSNVDMSEEFTNMIVTQRGFQANSRIITTSDSMLEELVNLKR